MTNGRVSHMLPWHGNRTHSFISLSLKYLNSYSAVGHAIIKVFAFDCGKDHVDKCYHGQLSNFPSKCKCGE